MTGCLTKIKEQSLPNYLPTAGVEQTDSCLSQEHKRKIKHKQRRPEIAGRSLRSVMSKVLDYNIVVFEFDLYSRYYVPWERHETPYSPSC